MDYPLEAIKGVPNENYLIEGQYASATLFQFQDRPQIQRDDNCLEESVNWNDDDGALSLLLHQQKGDLGDIQFKAGAFIIPREKIDEIRAHPLCKIHFAYERKALDGNKYHGNLLLKRSVPSEVKKMVTNLLAFACGFGSYVTNDTATE